MVILEQFNILIGIFKFVGFAPFNEIAKNVKIINILNIIPIILTSIISLCISYFLLLHPHSESYSYPIHRVIQFASLLTLSLTVLSANAQCFFYKTIHRNINHQIHEMENKIYSEIVVRSKLSFQYRLKVLIIFFLFFLSQGLVFYEAWLVSAEGAWSSFFTSLLRSIFPIALLHVILYSDIIANFMQELNRKINHSPICFYSSSKIEFLKNVKQMHADIWKIFVLINNFCGWNLLFLVLNSFVYITYQIYWIFVTLQNQWDKLGVIEGIASLIYGTTGLYILIHSCQSCSLEVKYLTENIEQYVFWTSDSEHLHHLKIEIFHQVNNLDMSITACNILQIDKRLLGEICAACCMYIIIFIQFFLASETKQH